MTDRLQTFLTGFLALLTAALLALAPASANPASGGYQLIEPIALEHQQHIQLASLGNFDYHAKVASECCNATNRGRFSGITARNTDEAQFLRNAEATFGNSTTWTGVTRHRGELVVQRSDIELSPQNVTRLRNGNAPFVRNSSGEWEPLQLHHVGRETGQLIEVTRSQNRYNSTTGGPLHIPGPGGPVRQPNYSQTYWQERYQSFVNSGQIVE